LGEELEDARQYLGGDAHAIICHQQDDLTAGTVSGYPDMSPLGGVFGSVVQQISHDLGEPNGVCLHVDRLCW
jgi:hypothetical protein